MTILFIMHHQFYQRIDVGGVEIQRPIMPFQNSGGILSGEIGGESGIPDTEYQSHEQPMGDSRTVRHGMSAFRRIAFERMTGSMSEIQHTTYALFLRVFGHNPLLIPRGEYRSITQIIGRETDRQFQQTII